jgi:hypothetical protein
VENVAINRLPKNIREFKNLMGKLGTDISIVFQKLKGNYVKLAQDRTTPVRFGTAFNSIQDECAALCKMYDTNP